LGGLALVFRPMDISRVDWLPCILCLSASSSLASLRDFLPALFDGLSKVSSSDEPDISGVSFLSCLRRRGKKSLLLGFLFEWEEHLHCFLPMLGGRPVDPNHELSPEVLPELRGSKGFGVDSI
jgi:hypothetical protein